MTSISLTENDKQDILSHILQNIFAIACLIYFLGPKYV